jgi:hypothetical protein
MARHTALRLKSALDPNAGQGARDDLVEILIRLSRDVERFHELVDVQRRVLEERGTHPVDLSDDELAREARRLSREAERVAASAHQALQEMRRLAPGGAGGQVELDRG